MYYRYQFTCNQWLAVDRDDGKTCRTFVVNDPHYRSSLSSGHLRTDLCDKHLWLSVILRPTPSSFTRVQRLSCCLSFFFMSMIASAMWYRAPDEDVEVVIIIQLGVIRVTWYELYASVMTCVSVIPVNLMIIAIFRLSSERDRVLSASSGEMPESEASDGAQCCRLPTRCVYVGYVMVFMAVTSSAFFTVLYSLQWGAEKSSQWLVSMLISVLQACLVVDPILVGTGALGRGSV